jgi:CBS domain-containing protein
MRIYDILRTKGADVVTIAPDASVTELLELLTQRRLGAVVVSSDGTTVDGIVSERDLVWALGADTGVLEAPVRTIMTSDVRTCGPKDTVDALARTMTEHRIRHVPVVEDGALAGIVSIGDVVKSRIDQLEHEQDALNSYIHST